MDYNENVKLRTGGMYVPRDKSTLSIEMGKRMAIQRKKLRLTQEMVAERAGITHQQYSKIENGRACTGSDTLLSLSQALQTSADFLLKGQHYDRIQDSIQILESMTDQEISIANQILHVLCRNGETDIPDT